MLNNNDNRRGLPHRGLSRRALGVTAAGTGTAAFLAACGSKKGPGASGSTPAGAAQQGKPRSGGQINLTVNADPFNFDPTGKPVDNAAFIILAYDCLLTAQFGPGVAFADLVIQPSLADRWETPDGQNFTFHLHPGVKFADVAPVNGRALSAADVKWSIEYLSRTGQFKGVKPASANDSMYEGLDRVETPDDATVVVRFGAPFIPFLAYMANGRNQILAHEVHDQYGDFVKHMAGSGPWQLDEAASQSGQRWVLKKNANYWQTGKPYMDQVNYLVIHDDATLLAAFKSKQTDILSKDAVTVDNAPQIRKDNPNAMVYEYKDTAGGHLFENVRKPPLDDVRIRRAIALCIDRDEFLKVFAGGKGDWALAGDFPDLFTQAEVKQIAKVDPAQAKQLIAAAGFPNGLDIEFMTPGPDRGQQYLNTVQLIQAQLKKGNINATLKVLDQPTQSQRLRAGNFFLEYETKQRLADIDAYLFYTFYSKSTGNYGGINDPDLDKLLVASRQEVDVAKRKAILQQAVRRIADQAWSVSFYYGNHSQFWQPYVKNFWPSALYYSSEPIFDTWLEK